MKKLKYTVFILAIFCNTVLFSQQIDPPEATGGHGQNTNQVTGGGAPIGDGLLMLLTLSLVYVGSKKLYMIRERKNS
jgi:hypothetical protein